MTSPIDRILELKQWFAEEPLAQVCRIKMIGLRASQCILEMTVNDKMAIRCGIAQGGVTTILADYAAVYAAMSVVPLGHTPARNINIHFLRPAKVGDLLLAEAAVVNRSRSAILVDVKVRDDKGRLMAGGTIDFATPSAG